MKKASLFWTLAVSASLLSLSGCSNTVRYLTTMKWLSAPGGPGGAGATAPGGAADGRTLYVTYWEGTCTPKYLPFLGGCTLGDSKIRRCNVKPDNQLECVDEAEATQAFARQK